MVAICVDLTKVIKIPPIEDAMRTNVNHDLIYKMMKLLRT